MLQITKTQWQFRSLSLNLIGLLLRPIINILLMKMSLFKLKKNRRYNYTPRYYRGKEGVNLYDFDSKFSKYRDAFSQNDFGQQWQYARLKMRNRSNRVISIRLLIIIFTLVMVFLYVIDFDLSLFRG